MHEFSKSSNEKEASQFIEKQAVQEENRIQAIATEIKVMNAKKETLKTEIENDKKIQAEMNESNENLEKSLKDIEQEITSIETMRSPVQVEDPEIASPFLKELEANRKRLLQ